MKETSIKKIITMQNEIHNCWKQLCKDESLIHQEDSWKHFQVKYNYNLQTKRLYPALPTGQEELFTEIVYDAPKMFVHIDFVTKDTATYTVNLWGKLK